MHEKGHLSVSFYGALQPVILLFQFKSEGAALPRVAFHAEFRVVRFQDLFDDGKAQSRSAARSLPLLRRKITVPDIGQFLFRNTLTPVPDLRPYPSTVPGQGNLNIPPIFRVTEGIVDQVVQYSPQAAQYQLRPLSRDW